MYVPDVESCGDFPIPVFKDEYLEGVMSDGTYCFVKVIKKEPLELKLRLVGPNKSYTFDLK